MINIYSFFLVMFNFTHHKQKRYFCDQSSKEGVSIFHNQKFQTFKIHIVFFFSSMRQYI
jgi:hypothetical protein